MRRRMCEPTRRKRTQAFCATRTPTQIIFIILGPWGGVFTKMKTKNKPSILELTVSIFLCLDLPDFVPWGGVFLNKKIYKNFVLNFDV
jgi:hypothetical protein